MKRAIASAAVAALVVLGASGVAGASPGGWTFFSVGPFYFGPNSTTTWTCQGIHFAGASGSTDIQTCQITGDTSGIVPGTYRSDPSLGLGTAASGCPNAALGIVPGFFGGGPTCWSSDYNGAFATAWSQTFIPNFRGNGYTFILVAFYQ